jgi:hypothetical protein
MAIRKRQSAYCVKRHTKRTEAAGKESCQKETIGHIQSAGCLGQKEVVTAAHNVCIRELLQAVDMHGKTDRHMKLLTIERESRLGTLWDQEQCTQVCCKEELWEAAKEEEMRIPWKEGGEESSVSEKQYQERSWRRRLDGIGLHTVIRVFLAVEFKRTQDSRSNHVERAAAAVQDQYKSLLAGIQAVGRVNGWQAQQIDPIRQKLVRRLLEEQNKVLRSYFAQKGGARGQKGEGFTAKVGNMSSGTCTFEEGVNSVCGPKLNDQRGVRKGGGKLG